MKWENKFSLVRVSVLWLIHFLDATTLQLSITTLTYRPIALTSAAVLDEWKKQTSAPTHHRLTNSKYTLDHILCGSTDMVQQTDRIFTTRNVCKEQGSIVFSRAYLSEASPIFKIWLDVSYSYYMKLWTCVPVMHLVKVCVYFLFGNM